MSGPAKFRNNVKVSERHGAAEWATEKLALLLLMPLGVWVASTAFTLAGRDVRVVDPDDTRLRATLTDAGLDATVTEVVPTIEERMTALAHP